MFLNLNKQFEFCICHKHENKSLSSEKNKEIFGYDFKGKYGHGHNLIANLILEGPVDPETGMVINLSKVKQHVSQKIISTLDHHYLNADIDFFNTKMPTFGNIAQYILMKSKELFNNTNILPVACHLQESWEESATSFQNGLYQKTLGIHIIYPINITLHCVFEGKLNPITEEIITKYEFFKLMQENEDINDLLTDQGYKINESVLKKSFSFLKKIFPNLKRILITTDPMITYEITEKEKIYLSIGTYFRATHCLLNTRKTQTENENLFGYCARPHGHNFKLEATISAEKQPLPDLLRHLFSTLTDFLLPYDCEHLNDFFEDKLASCETIIQHFMNKFEKKGDISPFRLRLQETRNNRFTLRKEKPQWH